MNKYAVYFRWAVIAGILQDWFFAIPGLMIPKRGPWVLRAWNQRSTPSGRRFACVTLLLLSIAYIPGAVDPFRNSLMAFFTVVARLGGVILFFIVYPGMFPPLFGFIDVVLTLVQGTLLALTYYVGPNNELLGGSPT